MISDTEVATYLAGQFKRGDVVLFTGAGFSVGARNVAGEHLPLSIGLKRAIWSLVFPSDEFDPTTSLQDLFEYGRLNAKNNLRMLLQRALAVDASSLPGYYLEIFDLPWLRAYTLNIDDLSQAVQRRESIRRAIVEISALSPGHQRAVADLERELEVICLNGTLEHAPDGVTFSTTQYAKRLASQEPLYARCVSDLLAHPVVFIGTPLDESPLWQHVELRRRGSSAGREFRRRSFLVTPELDRARRELLATQFNVVHLAMTTEEFADRIVRQLAPSVAEGYEALRRSQRAQGIVTEAPIVAELAAADPQASTDYLLGQTPCWADLHGGRAIVREVDREIDRIAKEMMAIEGAKPVLLIGGTAGSGKSTAAMRIALSITAAGAAVGWVDAETDISPHAIVSSMRQEKAPQVLVVDDADRYGTAAPVLAHDVTTLSTSPLVILASRSTKLDRIADQLEVRNTKFREITMPPLADSDISDLLSVLDHENRLGILKGESESARFRAFRDQAGRQLLIAMLQATSGRRFEERIAEELNELAEPAQMAYAIVAVATAMRSGLTRDEVITALDDRSNEALDALDSLIRRHLVFTRPRRTDLAVRHRVIAEVIVTELGRDGRLADVLARVAFASAAKVFAGIPRQGFLYRRIRSLMNHDFLQNELGSEGTRRLLAGLEDLMHWDYHYWLQRGSVEVESGDMKLAENFLGQAHSLAPDDVLVMTENGYLKLRLAVAAPTHAMASDYFEEGASLLEDAIDARSASDPHPFQILGSQCRLYCRRADVEGAEATRILQRVIQRLEDGCRINPRDDELRQLLVALRDIRRSIP